MKRTPLRYFYHPLTAPEIIRSKHAKIHRHPSHHSLSTYAIFSWQTPWKYWRKIRASDQDLCPLRLHIPSRGPVVYAHTCTSPSELIVKSSLEKPISTLTSVDDQEANHVDRCESLSVAAPSDSYISNNQMTLIVRRDTWSRRGRGTDNDEPDLDSTSVSS